MWRWCWRGGLAKTKVKRWQKKKKKMQIHSWLDEIDWGGMGGGDDKRQGVEVEQKAEV